MLTLKVEGMSCEHCVRSIEGALGKLGVKAKVDLTSKTVTVETTENVSIHTVRNVIEDLGFTVLD